MYYGGAAGGGKTQLAIGLALTRHRNSLILRRQSVDTKGIVEAIRSIPGVGKWKQVGYGGELRTPDGRLIEVGGCQHEEDWQKYAGRPHDFIDLDELPQFSKKQFTMLTAWNRVAEPERYPNQRSRVVGGGNPPLNPEGEWVLERWGAWIDPTRGELTPAGVLRWYAVGPDGEVEVPNGDPVTLGGKTVKPRSRTFIPARLEDNPGLLGTGYDATLDSLPEPIRSALRYGDMAASRVDDRWQLIPTAWVVAAQRRWADLQKSWPTPDRPPCILSAVGTDVARGGSDRTAIAPRYGNVIGNLTVRKGSETPDGQSVVALLIPILSAGGPMATVNIDADGVGGSAYDLTQAQVPKWRNARAIHSGTATDWFDPRHPGLGFSNLRSAMWWNLRALLNPEGDPATRLALPPDRELLADLTAPRYRLTVRGIQVEPKEDHADGPGIRKRIGRSTDKGDAVALACFPGDGKKPLIWGKT